MIERFIRVVGAVFSLAKESMKAQALNKNKYNKYMTVYSELLSYAMTIKKRKTMILEDLENKNLDTRFIRNDRKIPDYLGIRYVFISDIQPGKLYREVPKLNQNGFGEVYDTCYVNSDNQVLRRIASEERFPNETLFFYQNNEATEVSFNYHDNETITGVSKATFNRETNILEIEEIEMSLGDFGNELSSDRIPVYDCVIRIDKYSFHDSELAECSFNYCKPLATWFPHFPKVPDKTKWEIYESKILIERNENHSPVEYINEWTLSDYRLIEYMEKNRITQKQHAAITRLERKLYI